MGDEFSHTRRGEIIRGLLMFERRPKRRKTPRWAKGAALQAAAAQQRRPRFSPANRRALLMGTAFVSSLLASTLDVDRAHAQAVNIVSGSPVTLTNNADCISLGFCASIITVAPVGAFINFTNNGDFATLGVGALGINLTTASLGGSIRLRNRGDIATLGGGAIGINAITTLGFSPINITNRGDIATAGGAAIGISALTTLPFSSINVTNRGDIATAGIAAIGISGITLTGSSGVKITNTGEIQTRAVLADGIFASTIGAASPVNVVNRGTIDARGRFAFGIEAVTTGPASPIRIQNSGNVSGRTAGIDAFSATSTRIVNSGEISATSLRAIDIKGARSRIRNSGLISGFVDLTNSADRFFNRSGGVFDAMRTSEFRGGRDIFINRSGGTVRTAHTWSASELTVFEGLERFENSGLITMVDGRNHDVFRISNTPGGTNLNFVGKGDSTLAVDTFLGGPGSTSDRFIIQGNSSGRTLLTVNNTNPGSGALNTAGIPVIFVDGTVNADDFYLEQPIDAGFVDYDLFFVPTNSGFFELRSHTGGGSHLLPHIVEFSHITFHNTSETWFDRSTDLRVLLARGEMCSDPLRRDAAYDESYTRCEELYSATPGVWVRGAGNWFELEDHEVTNANGRTYRHNLKRDLDIWQVQTGVDFGKRDWLADGDALVFGVLGGAIKSTLDYQAIVRTFNIEGWEVGAYATYLNGGLFVDTLFKTIFADVDPKDVRGFPDTLNNTTYGFRADTGYRFGNFQQGAFVEPLATIAASWTHIDDFTRDGNAVNFRDDENVRGRVGLRLGTSSEVWEGTTMEPFVVGSLWGTLSGSHSATLISTGQLFTFTDDPEDIWGEVSAGVNFFNPSAQTSVFAKVDYTFADETQGIGFRGGMRYNW